METIHFKYEANKIAKYRARKAVQVLNGPSYTYQVIVVVGKVLFVSAIMALLIAA